MYLPFVIVSRGRADVIVLTEHAGWGVDDLLDEAGPLRDVEVRNADNPLHNQLLML